MVMAEFHPVPTVIIFAALPENCYFYIGSVVHVNILLSFAK